MITSFDESYTGESIRPPQREWLLEQKEQGLCVQLTMGKAIMAVTIVQVTEAGVP